ncbi:uncharacterized protein LOC130277437 [Hyla sarda]|uniref:uncharacterized protein LOC130277437 n=1 Tax=Hyla sarda TaxID=327740 RepID=UPI0024C23BCA|nr:uncharacterized protein LOC130277437 [Hyla sarda]
MGILTKQRRGTSVVPHVNIQFSTMEELVRKTFATEQIEGVADLDVMALAHQRHDNTSPIAPPVEEPERPADQPPTADIAQETIPQEIETGSIEEDINNDIGFTPAQTRFLNDYTERNQANLKVIANAVVNIDHSLKVMCQLYAQSLQSQGVSQVAVDPPTIVNINVETHPSTSLGSVSPQPASLNLSVEGDVASTSSGLTLHSVSNYSGLFPRSRSLTPNINTQSDLFAQSPPQSSVLDLSTHRVTCPTPPVLASQQTNNPSSTRAEYLMDVKTEMGSVLCSSLPSKKRLKSFPNFDC